jgi:hypothetical protein
MYNSGAAKIDRQRIEKIEGSGTQCFPLSIAKNGTMDGDEKVSHTGHQPI